MPHVLSVHLIQIQIIHFQVLCLKKLPYYIQPFPVFSYELTHQSLQSTCEDLLSKKYNDLLFIVSHHTYRWLDIKRLNTVMNYWAFFFKIQAATPEQLWETSSPSLLERMCHPCWGLMTAPLSLSQICLSQLPIRAPQSWGYELSMKIMTNSRRKWTSAF